MERKSLFDLTQEELRIENAIIEGGGEVTPELEEAMSNNTLARRDKVTSYNHLDTIWTGKIDTLAAAIKRLQDEKRVLENGKKRLKENLKDCMVALGVSRIEGDMCQAYIRNNPAKVECDEEAILKRYDDMVSYFTVQMPKYIKVSLSLDRKALKDEIEAGNPTPQARLVQEQTVVFK